jgi:hypothetical protein
MPYYAIHQGKRMSISSKLNQENDVELLLNDIYEMPDLKEDVFSYINPYILKASVLLNRTRRGEKVFDNKDNERKLENILYREFPDLVNAYGKMPIEYRNTHRLKTGKTSRQTLISSFHILTQSIRDIEHDSLKDANQLLEVKNQSLREKYQVDNFTETESEYHDNFNWGQYERSHVVSAQNLMEQSFYHPGKMNASAKNKASVRLNSKGQMRIQQPWSQTIKEKACYLMDKSGVVLKKAIAGIKRPFDFLNYIHPFFKTMIGVFAFIGLGTYTMVTFTHWYRHTSEATLNLYNLTSEIQTESDAQKALGQKLLQKFFSEHSNAKFILDAKTGRINMTETLSNWQCERTIKEVEQKFDRMPYQINGIWFDAGNHQTDDSREMVCDNPHNTYSVNFDTVAGN